ncbi:MAG TPA: glycosyltransferase [Gaiellaceae bacterium]|nr:glycosyltransferase [Gaiellaceae bacterium]
MIEIVLPIIVLACFTYLVLTNLGYAAFVVVSFIETFVRRHHRESQNLEVLGRSRFTIPVSVVLSAYDEEPTIVSAVESLLGLDYPEFEVIVVNDGSRDRTFDRIVEAFELEQYEMFVRSAFPTEAVRATYRSRAFPNLVVVDKENGGKADGLNAGINAARYPYIAGVDADTVFDRDALLASMSRVIEDPERIVGVTSYIGIAENPERAMAFPLGRRPVDIRPFIVYQHQDYLRAFLTNRIAFSRLGTMLCTIGAFQIWRRDVLEEVGGYSRGFTCEDIELTFRVHERFRREDRDYEVISLPYNVGATEGPDTARKLMSQRERWHRVISETVWHYRGMWFRKRYGTVGMLGAPFYFVAEVLAPVFEVLTVVAIAGALAFGLFDPGLFLLTACAIAFVNAALTACAILLDDLQSRTHRVRDLVWMLFLAPFDLVLYRPVIFWARVEGSWRLLRGDKEWHKFERNVRPA